MRPLHRRAIVGTIQYKTVPEVAQYIHFTCQNMLNLAQNNENSLCHTWHKNIDVVTLFSFLQIINNSMIIQWFLICTHRCEVCERNNPVNNKIKKVTELHSHHFLKISLSDFQRKQTVFLPKNLDKLNHNF